MNVAQIKKIWYNKLDTLSADFGSKNVELINSLNMRDMNFVERKDCQYPEEFDSLDDVDDDEPVEMKKVR